MTSPKQNSELQTSENGAKPPFDPLARHVDQETGLEYEDIAAKICGRPLESQRNARITSLTKLRYPKTAVKAYWQGFDAHVVKSSLSPPWYPGADAAGIEAGKAAGCWGPADFKPVAKGDLNAWFATRFDKTVYGVLSGKRDDFGVIKINCGT